MGALCVKPGFDKLALQPIANFEGLAEQVNLDVGRDLSASRERYALGRDWQVDERNVEVRGQLLQLRSPSILLGRQATHVTPKVLGGEFVFHAGRLR